VLFAAARVTPERLYPWLSLGSGLLILGVGASMLVSRWRRPPPGDGHHHGSSDEHDHEHDHDHEHEHEHRHGLFTHTHATSRQTSGWRVVLLGISGGLLPCPSALVVMLAAISLHRVAFGMALIVAFSLGLALVLTGLGLAVAGGVPLLRRVPRLRELAGGRLTWRLLPVASAAVVSVAGLAMTVQALAGGL
jgi:ABC-type nickel/cobalt efflux system permease component RcnA